MQKFRFWILSQLLCFKFTRPIITFSLFHPIHHQLHSFIRDSFMGDNQPIHSWMYSILSGRILFILAGSLIHSIKKASLRLRTVAILLVEILIFPGMKWSFDILLCEINIGAEILISMQHKGKYFLIKMCSGDSFNIPWGVVSQWKAHDWCSDSRQFWISQVCEMLYCKVAYDHYFIGMHSLNSTKNLLIMFIV